MVPDTSRTTTWKIRLFRRLFSGLPNVYGTYDVASGRVRQVKAPVTDRVILAHLRGRQPYGVYLLVNDRTRAVVVDFDTADLDSPQRFRATAGQYNVPAYIERSKAKGHHVWIFFEEGGVPARKARLVACHILSEIDQSATEVFPKQDRLTGGTAYGNFINAPLFGALITKGRTVFVNPDRGFKPYSNQWRVLENVQRIPETLLDEIIEWHGLNRTDRAPAELRPGLPGIHASFGLPPCAQRMLAEGVSEYQRVACFRLAVHLKKAGVPRDVAVAGLRAWAAKNHPKGDRRVITEAEVAEQTAYAYAKSYRGCGCEEPAVMPYCEPHCSLRSHAGARAAPEDHCPRASRADRQPGVGRSVR